MKDRVDKAFETIKGYCLKRTSCGDGCRYNGEDGCVFQRHEPPVDWESPRNNQ